MKLLTLLIRLRMFRFSGWVFKNEFPLFVVLGFKFPNILCWIETEKGECYVRSKNKNGLVFRGILVEILLFVARSIIFRNLFLART